MSKKLDKEIKKITPNEFTYTSTEQLFSDLLKQYLNENKAEFESISTSILLLIINICLMEESKIDCRDYIKKEGVMIYWQNGANQEGYRENPCVPRMNQTIEQQRKLLSELKLTPSSSEKIIIKEERDEFIDFIIRGNKT